MNKTHKLILLFALAIVLSSISAYAVAQYLIGTRTIITFKKTAEDVGVYYRGKDVTASNITGTMPISSGVTYWNSGIMFKALNGNVSRIGVYIRIQAHNLTELNEQVLGTMIVADNSLIVNKSASSFGNETTVYLEWSVKSNVDYHLYLNYTAFKTVFFFYREPCEVDYIVMYIDLFIVYQKPYS